MSIESMCYDSLEVLTPTHTTGDQLGRVTELEVTATVQCRVKGLPAVEVTRMRLDGQDVTHNIWFAEDPQIRKDQRLRWRGVLMRPVGEPIDCHGLGRLWLMQATTKDVDNEGVPLL